MEHDEIIEADGQYYWFNPEGGCYELVQITQSAETISAEAQIDESLASTSAAPASNSKLQVATLSAPRTEVPSSTSASANKWDENQTLLLLDLCKALKHELDNPRIKKMDVFNKISAEMKNKGHHFTWLQCQNRMKTLLTKYKEVKDHNNKSGNSPKNWAYLDAMDAYCGDRPNVTPVQCVGTSSLSLQSDNQASLCPNSLKMKTPRIQRKITSATSPRNKMLAWLQKESQEAKERERERMDAAERHHQENAQLFKEFLGVMKAKMADNTP